MNINTPKGFALIKVANMTNPEVSRAHALLSQDTRMNEPCHAHLNESWHTVSMRHVAQVAATTRRNETTAVTSA